MIIEKCGFDAHVRVSALMKSGFIKVILLTFLMTLSLSNLSSQPQAIANLNVLGAEFGDYEIKINKSNLGKFSDCREQISIAGLWRFN